MEEMPKEKGKSAGARTTKAELPLQEAWDP